MSMYDQRDGKSTRDMTAAELEKHITACDRAHKLIMAGLRAMLRTTAAIEAAEGGCDGNDAD